MELLNILVARILAEQLPNFPLPELAQLVELEAVQILEKIRAVLADEGIDDPSCFTKIEEIVNIFEEKTVPVGGRHDFG